VFVVSFGMNAHPARIETVFRRQARKRQRPGMRIDDVLQQTRARKAMRHDGSASSPKAAKARMLDGNSNGETVSSVAESMPVRGPRHVQARPRRVQ